MRRDDLEPYWSGSLARAGQAPSLTSYQLRYGGSVIPDAPLEDGPTEATLARNRRIGSPAHRGLLTHEGHWRIRRPETDDPWLAQQILTRHTSGLQSTVIAEHLGMRVEDVDDFLARYFTTRRRSDLGRRHRRSR